MHKYTHIATVLCNRVPPLLLVAVAGSVIATTAAIVVGVMAPIVICSVCVGLLLSEVTSKMEDPK